MERDLTIEEMIEIGTQLFPEEDPQDIVDFIESVKAESPETTNSDILNSIIHMVVDKKGQAAPKLDKLRSMFNS